jgi:hypothetical protein
MSIRFGFYVKGTIIRVENKPDERRRASKKNAANQTCSPDVNFETITAIKAKSAISMDGA